MLKKKKNPLENVISTNIEPISNANYCAASESQFI